MRLLGGEGRAQDAEAQELGARLPQRSSDDVLEDTRASNPSSERAAPAVSREPPESSPGTRISVASESRTFHFVRCR
jgi:hypothetical protein